MLPLGDGVDDVVLLEGGVELLTGDVALFSSLSKQPDTPTTAVNMIKKRRIVNVFDLIILDHST
jgi:hypothetical protein